MHGRVGTSVLVAASLWSGAAIAGVAPEAIALQPPGTFHEGEAVARDGESWLALRTVGGDAALVPTRLRVTRVVDELFGETDTPTADRVEGEGDESRMYVRGAPFSPGHVPMAQVVQQAGGELVVDIRFDARQYRIAQACRPTGVLDGQARYACELRLTQGARHQVLARMDGHADTPGAVLLGDDATPKVIFAGDLDGDGALDLIFDITDHYNVSRPALFLSTGAKAGEFVREAARYESTGC